MNLYLTPASLSHLTLFIMAVLITGYLVIRFGGWRVHHPAHLRLLTAFLTALTLFAFLLLLESALPPGVRLFALYAQNTVLGVVLILLLQFAYHFPAAWPRRWETRLVLVLSVLYTLYEAGYAVYRYGLTLRHGQVLFRPEWADFPLALGLIWVPIVLLRQASRASRQSQPDNHRSGLHHLWRPHSEGAGAARALALIYLLPVVLAVLTILKTFYLVPPTVYQLSLSVGLLVALASFTLVYLNFLPETTSFIVKLVGVMLVTLLAVMGTVGWVLAPAYASLYRPTWPADQQTLRFTPNAQGGYDIATVPFQFQSDFGKELNLVDTIRKIDDQTSVKLPFEFPFYGRPYSEIYVTNDGVIGLGQSSAYSNYQYRYGGQTPLIFPLLTDLNPGEGRGQIFARQAADRLVITFDRVPSFYRPEDLFTFQIALQNDGIFDITYNALPEPQTYRADDEPMANLWVVGSTPGNLDTAPQALDLSQLYVGQTITSGPQGIVQDYYLGLRRQLNDLLQPLAWLMIMVSVLAVAGFPWLLQRSLVRPLNRLLNGVQQLEAGDYAVHVPVRNHDEIGFLTRAFNSLAAQLDDLIHNLSTRVAERTDELSQAKTVAEEQRQIAEIANVQLEANVHELQARNEELDAFSHTVAHDIRGPVSQIVGYAELLGDTEYDYAPDDRTHFLHVILRASDKLVNIIDELLLLAGVRSVEVLPEPLNMAAIVAEAQGRLTEAIEETGAEITIPIASAWPTALGHPAWVEEVWVNYLSNACKYGGFEGRPPQITVGAGPLPNPPPLITGEGADTLPSPPSSTGGTEGGYIRFWVRDAGCGLTPADQARLFTPFTRLEQVRVKGHGLGLSIVRRIVEKLGGEVAVESDGVPGHGSVFSFTLPAAPLGTVLPLEAEPPATPLKTAAPATASLDLAALRGLTVLLVDDDALFAESVHSLLTARGLTVLGVAHDGLEAEDLAGTLQPQLVLMDIDMPRQSGLEATRLIKAAQPEIKIVMLTASERDDHLFEALRHGASGYLLKGTPADMFCAQLAALTRGEVPLSPGLADRVLAELARTSPSPATTGEGQGRGSDNLTDRQWDILERVAHGQTYKEIGADLHLTEPTIKYHMGQIVERLHVENRVQAVAYLRRTRRPPQT